MPRTRIPNYFRPTDRPTYTFLSLARLKTISSTFYLVFLFWTYSEARIYTFCAHLPALFFLCSSSLLHPVETGQEICIYITWPYISSTLVALGAGPDNGKAGATSGIFPIITYCCCSIHILKFLDSTLYHSSFLFSSFKRIQFFGSSWSARARPASLEFPFALHTPWVHHSYLVVILENIQYSSPIFVSTDSSGQHGPHLPLSVTHAACPVLMSCVVSGLGHHRIIHELIYSCHRGGRRHFYRQRRRPRSICMYRVDSTSPGDIVRALTYTTETMRRFVSSAVNSADIIDGEMRWDAVNLCMYIPQRPIPKAVWKFGIWTSLCFFLSPYAYSELCACGMYLHSTIIPSLHEESISNHNPTHESWRILHRGITRDAMERLGPLKWDVEPGGF